MFDDFSRRIGSAPAYVSGVLLALSGSRFELQVACRPLPIFHLAELDAFSDEFRSRIERQVAHRRLPVLHFS